MSEELSISEVLQVRRDKLAKLQSMGRDPFKIEKFVRTAMSSDIHNEFEKYDGKEVRIAGRIMAKRSMGRASFLDIQDMNGRIQTYLREDAIGEEEYEIVSTYDMGDIVGIVGTVFKTKKDEDSLRISEIVLLSKSLQILPEKFHGLKDTDTRYRQRYVDLIVNPEVKKTFLQRNKILRAVREYLDDNGFLEVETPILSTIAGGAVAKPFITHHNTLDIDMYMRIANELYLKRLIVGGFDKVYEMGKMFRNEGMSIKHNPEYTAIEMYAAYEDFDYVLALTENLVAHCCMKANGTTKINYQGTELDFAPPWRRLTMTEAVKLYAGVDFNEISTDEEAREAGKKLGLEVDKDMKKGHVINEAFERFCEEYLIQPTFITHHPVEVSPLAKRNSEDPTITNRFEAFAYTWEIANAFSELNDPIDQRARFEEQLVQREGGNEEAHMMDDDFINALEVGLPPTGGLGIGIDRVVMLLTNSASIRDVILFPTMKPIGK